MKLTPKQEMFIKEYLCDLNATQAAIRAGYSERTAKEQGSRLLTKVHVRTRIDAAQAERAKKLELDAEWVLERLQDIVEKSSKVKPVEKWNHADKKLVETGEYVYDSHGANKALELIGKHLGMFKDKIEHSGGLVVINGENNLED